MAHNRHAAAQRWNLPTLRILNRLSSHPRRLSNLGRALATAMIAHSAFAQTTTPTGDSGRHEQSGVGAPTSAGDGEFQSLVAQLFDRQSDAATRLSAATALLRGNDPNAPDVLVRALASDEPAGTRSSILNALTTAPAPPPQLLTPLIELLRNRGTPDRGLIVAALGRYRTRDAVGAVIGLVQPTAGEDPALVALALATLRRQTGRNEVSAAEWIDWWSASAQLSPREWYESLAQSLGERNAQNERRTADLSRRLTDSYRRLHALLPEGERSTLITDLIGSEAPELCMLGFDLAKRALLNARSVDARVGDAAIRRLADPSASIRAEAASLISRLDQPRAGSALASALHIEQDEAAASAMLRALAREPVANAAPDVIHWLEVSDIAAPAAAEAALSLRQAGFLSDPALVTRTGSALRRRSADQLTPASGALLTLIGEEQAAIALLGTAKPEVADAVAAALAELPAGLDPLMDVAHRRPRLAPTAIAAMARFRPTAEGFAQAAMLCGESDDAARAALGRYALCLPPAELLRVAKSEADPNKRADYLQRIPVIAATEAVADRATVAELALLLAHTRLELKDPAGALEAMAPFSGKEWAATFDPTRVTALLWLFKLPQAEEVSMRSGVSVSHWLDGLEYAIDLPYAIDIADQIRRVFGDTLDEASRSRLETADRYILSDLSGPPAIIN